MNCEKSAHERLPMPMPLAKFMKKERGRARAFARAKSPSFSLHPRSLHPLHPRSSLCILYLPYLCISLLICYFIFFSSFYLHFSSLLTSGCHNHKLNSPMLPSAPSFYNNQNKKRENRTIRTHIKCAQRGGVQSFTSSNCPFPKKASFQKSLLPITSLSCLPLKYPKHPKMPSSELFAVRLPLFLLLGTMTSVVVFFPMGCGAMHLNALAPATNNAAAPPVGAASLGPNPLLHKTPSGRLVGLPSASVNFPNANNPAVPLVHNGSGTRSHFLPVQALPADNASGVDSGDEAGKSHDTSHLIGFGLGPIFPDHQMQKDKDDGSSNTAKTNEEIMQQQGTNNEESESTGKRHHSLEPDMEGLLRQYDNLLNEYKKIRSEEEQNGTHAANGLVEEKSKLATKLFAIKIDHKDGTKNPLYQVQKQIDMIKAAIQRLNAHPNTGFDVVSNDIQNNPLLRAKLAIQPRLRGLLTGLTGVKGVYEKERVGKQLMDEPKTEMDKKKRGGVAMEAAGKISAHYKSPEPAAAQEGDEAEEHPPPNPKHHHQQG